MRTPSLAALLLLAACGKPLLYAEVEIPSAVVQVPQQPFDPITNTDLCANPQVAGNLCSQTVIKYDLGQDYRDLVKDAVAIDVRLNRLAIALTAAPGVLDFGHVAKVRILAVDAATPPNAIELAHYVRDPADPNPAEIMVGTRSTVNLGAYIQAGTIDLRAELETDPGGLPGFTADVTGDFYLLVTVDWGKKAGIL